VIKVIRLRTQDGNGSKAAFIALNITRVIPTKDNTSLVFTAGDQKGVKVYESTDEIEQMITMETIGAAPQQAPITYPQIESEC
jgi:hypothetical protein